MRGRSGCVERSAALYFKSERNAVEIYKQEDPGRGACRGSRPGAGSGSWCRDADRLGFERSAAVHAEAVQGLQRDPPQRYSPDGGNAGVQDVQQGRSQFAINTRPPLKSDSGTTYFKLFLDGLCIVDNPKNALGDISIGETKNIFLATDTNWSQVPGSNLATTIDPVGRNSAAGLYTFFQQAVLGGKTQESNVNPLPADGLVANAVSRDPNAIGYVGLSHSARSFGAPTFNGPKRTGVKALTIGGVACDAAHIKNESYPLFRYDWGVLPTAHPSVQVEKFFDWVRTSKAAGQIIQRAGAVPAFNKK